MDPKKPTIGQLHIDASDIKVRDLATEQIVTMSKARDGVQVAVACLLRQTPELLERAGISPLLVKQATEYMVTHDRCDEVLPAAKKLVELLHETQIHARHELAGIIAEVAAQARRRADRDPQGEEILALLEELLDYHYGPAAKGMATKEKKKASKPRPTDEKPTSTSST